MAEMDIGNINRRSAVHLMFTVAVAAVFVTSAFAAVSVNVCSAEDPLVYWIGTVIDIDSLNPFTMTSLTSYAICGLMFEYILYTDPIEGTPCAQLAESWHASEDGRVWTYNISQTSYFHDGVQVTAHDVNFTYNMVLRNPKACSMLAGYLDGATDIRALDEFTIRITLEEARIGMTGIWIPILPEHIWTEIEADGQIDKVEWDSDYFADGFIRSGQFILDEWSKTQDHVRLLRWADYNDVYGAVNIDELFWKIYDSEETMCNALETGSIDLVLNVPVALWESTVGDEDVEGIARPSIRFKDFGFNCATQELRESVNDQGKPNFPQASDNYETLSLAFRQACHMAVNKTKIVEEIYQGFAVVGDSLVSTATPFWHYYVPEDEFMPFDIQAANDLLESAGYKYISSETVRENETSGVLLEFDLMYSNAYDVDVMIATEVASTLEQIGVIAHPTGVSDGILLTMWFGMEYDMFIWDWEPTLDPSWILAVLTTDEIPENSHDIASWSDVYYSNPYYDQLYEEQLLAIDVYERQAIVHEMQAIAYHDCPYSILCYLSTMIAYRTDDWYYPDMMDYDVREIWFYYELSSDAEPPINHPPENVDAGPDQTAYVGEELQFVGSAEDPDTGDVLTWDWTFTEPDSTEAYREGQTVSYTFLNEGVVAVNLTVTDVAGASASDEAIVTVSEMPEDVGWIRGNITDADMNPISGATVEAGDKVKVAGSDGKYNITIVPGTYAVNVSHDDYTNASVEVTVETGVVTWLDFTLSITVGSLSGKVFDLDTEEGIQGAKIVLSQDGVVKYTKYSGEDGSYLISSVSEGTYDVNVTASGYEFNETTVIIVAGDEETLDIYLVATEDDDDDDGGSISAVLLGGVALLALITITAVLLAKRKKKGGSMTGEDSVPSEDTDLPPPT